MSDKQCTIGKDFSLKGIGLHTGEVSNITFKPAKENTGYWFTRTDLPGKPRVKGDIDNVVDTSRGTTIEKNGAIVHTIEHALAAVYGLGIDNIEIEIDGPEVPILDGSAKYFAQALINAGIVEQDEDKDYFVLKENLAYEDEEKHTEMLAVPQDEFRLTVMVDYNSLILGTQHASMYHLGEFEEEISPCRTFVFLRELEYLAKNNLIKGGDLDNAIVLVDKLQPQEKLDELADLLGKPHIQIKETGVLNTTKLIFQNEPARHKLLDIVGDLSLVGKPIKAHILAARPGHKGNTDFARLIRKKINEEKRNKIPSFDLTGEPLFDIVGIQKLLPHRYPMLLVDKIIELSSTHVVGVKNVTFNEPFFQGHFPNAPVMPGVLIVEAMAQTGGILALNTVDNPEEYLTYFMKIDKTKFKNKVVPGDTLVFRLDLLTEIRRGVCHMKAVAYVGDKIVAEGELMAQIVKEK
ncbi:MAG TPA: UDP-3-O-[3-hydroxymyristoyl] N-acetylglucosamine deacetylase [Flavobacteriales bacterium]|nr:UDP-3-O-[3-hydroxymyristoyl] N-acetylglucosamine deacetylase [Flavobacteriales bacterium]